MSFDHESISIESWSDSHVAHAKPGLPLNICRYNSIQFFESCTTLEDDIDTIVVCDTPKPSMIERNIQIQALLKNPKVLKIEIDHHLGTDSSYIGDEGYCLVTQATSTSELVGHLAIKIQNMKPIMEQYQTDEIFTRNFILAILTGIIGDTNMGHFLKSRREGSRRPSL